MKTGFISENDRNTAKNRDNYNYGLAFLRIWMCFEVVIHHFRNWNGATIENLSLPLRVIYRYELIAVPVFMLSSFLLTNMSDLASDAVKIKKRFYRLFTPHIFWAIAYFLVYKFLDLYKGLELEKGIKYLIWQLIFGQSLNGTEWFQVDLILITLFFLLAFKLFDRGAIYFVWIMGYVAVFFQYSGLNVAMFDGIKWPEDFLPGYLTASYGRIMEMIPYAVIGILITSYGALDRIKNKRWLVLLLTVFTLYLLFHYKIFTTVERSFSYAGLYLILTSTASVLLFYFLPFGCIGSVPKRIICFISKYTLSVYYMHRMVATIIYNTRLQLWFRMRIGSVYDCIVIFFCCIVIGWLISIIPVKILKQVVT